MSLTPYLMRSSSTIFPLISLLYVRSYSGLVRDLAALNKHELLCQDVWGLGGVEDESLLSNEDRILLDKAAHLTVSGDDAFPQLHMVYEHESRLRVPPTITCYTQSGVKMVDLTDEEQFE